MTVTSTMQDDFQLTITAMLEHGTRVYGGSEVVTWQGDGARRAHVRRGRRERRAGWPRRSTGLGIGAATASARCAGTRRNISRPTSRCPAWARCCTR